MNKLAHSNEETMTLIEIKNAYNEMSENEFFNHLDTHSVEFNLIEKALGYSVLRDYMKWIYLYIK